MLSLLAMEIRRLRDHLLLYLGVLAASVLLFGQSESATVVGTLFAVFPLVVGAVIPINTFLEEERGNTILFLRALPLRPWEIVAAKYAASYVVVLALSLALLVASPWLPGISMERILGQVTMVTLMALSFAAVSYLLLFLLGPKRGRFASMAFFLGAILLTTRFGLSMVGPKRPEFWVALGATPWGPVLAVLVGTALVMLSYAVSARVFTARDVTRMP